MPTKFTSCSISALAITSAYTVIRQVRPPYEVCFSMMSIFPFAARAIEYMIIDALKAAEPKLRIAGQIKDPKRYVFLTDDIMARIESSDDPVSAYPFLYSFTNFLNCLEGSRGKPCNIRPYPHTRPLQER